MDFISSHGLFTILRVIRTKTFKFIKGCVSVRAIISLELRDVGWTV
jgi:hypothetical protein